MTYNQLADELNKWFDNSQTTNYSIVYPDNYGVVLCFDKREIVRFYHEFNTVTFVDSKFVPKEIELISKVLSTPIGQR